MTEYRNGDGWTRLEVDRFEDDMDAERCMMENVNHRYYRKLGNVYVVFEDMPSGKFEVFGVDGIDDGKARP